MHLHIHVCGFSRGWLRDGSHKSSIISNTSFINQMGQGDELNYESNSHHLLLGWGGQLNTMYPTFPNHLLPLVTAFFRLVIGYLSDCIRTIQCLSYTIIKKPCLLLLQDTGVILVQVTRQSAGILQSNHRDFLVRHLAGGVLVTITCKWSNCANTTHNSLALLWHRGGMRGDDNAHGKLPVCEIW